MSENITDQNESNVSFVTMKQPESAQSTLHDSHSSSGQYRPPPTFHGFQPFSLSAPEPVFTINPPQSVNMHQRRDEVMAQAQTSNNPPEQVREHDYGRSR